VYALNPFQRLCHEQVVLDRRRTAGRLVCFRDRRQVMSEGGGLQTSSVLTQIKRDGLAGGRQAAQAEALTPPFEQLEAGSVTANRVASASTGQVAASLQFLRNYLNEDASHFSFSLNSLRHIAKFSDPVLFDTHLKFHPVPFCENLSVLFAFLAYLSSAAVTCLAKDKDVPLELEPLAVEIARCNERGRSVFQTG
jgi:hypothetical protein